MERTELQAVSQLRVEEAEILLREGYYSGAYYLLGYAVECALKACIARRIIAHVIPDRRFIQAVYQHNLEQLFSLTDLVSCQG